MLKCKLLLQNLSIRSSTCFNRFQINSVNRSFAVKLNTNDERNFTRDNNDENTTESKLLNEELTDFRIKAKVQTENLNKSFELLYSHQLHSTKKKYVETPTEIQLKLNNKEFNESLRAYVDVCCSSDQFVNKAIEHLEFLVNQTNKRYETAKEKTNEKLPVVTKFSKKNYDYINDVEIFNRIMFELASKGQTSKVRYLFKLMRSINDPDKQIKPNLNSYAAVFQSLGLELNKVKDNKKRLAEIRLIIERLFIDLSKIQININSLSKMGDNFNHSQRMNIETAIRLIKPDFEFEFIKKTHQYSEFTQNLIKSVKENNELLNNDLKCTERPHYYNHKLLSKESLTKSFLRQLEDEKSLTVNVPSILDNQNFNNKEEKVLEEIKNVLMDRFKTNIHKNYLKSIVTLKSSNRLEDQFLVPFLTAMNVEIYLDILTKQVLRLAQISQYYSPTLSIFGLQLGTMIENKYHEYCHEKEQGYNIKLQEIYNEYLDYQLTRMKKREYLKENHREKWESLMEKYKLDTNINQIQWPFVIRSKLGKYILENIIIKSCKIDKSLLKSSPKFNKSYSSKNQFEYAFHKIYRLVGVYRDVQIKVHPLLFKLFRKTLVFETNLMPMIVPPMPWYHKMQGGYFLTKKSVLRIDDTQKSNLVLENEYIPPVFDSLNVLSTTPWRINKRILNLLIDVFNKNGDQELDVPEPAEKGPEIPKLPRSGDKSISKDELSKIYKSIEAAKKKRAEMHSLWCSELYRLSIANMYRDNIIWFPHSLDFRGRCYPIPPHFNHLGSDISRSLILLAEGKKLGPKGLDMLKLHLVNLTGTMKKSTLSERIEYANKIVDDVIDSAERPFNGKGWWKKSEEKWQTLACCMEINDAIKSGNPAEFISYFPVHQDGSCNGLQHYAALGRDKEGATSVNLSPSLRPQDVYSSVLELVENERKKDEQEIEIAAMLRDKIGRKTIKQTVMTTVYNVTFYGAKLQIQRQLEDLEDFPQEKIKEASGYIATKTFESIKKLFKSAREIQDWLSECAYLVSKMSNMTVRWETPLGLMVSQPYFKKSYLNNIRLGSTKIPNYMKQRNAFPPNFIHSLDSCHMMLTALYCEKANATFVSVHDCFWTHACSVDIMNRITREQFIALHCLPLLENLSDHFLKNYGFSEERINSEPNEKIKGLMIEYNRKLRNVPKKGEFNLNDVLKSVYFFS